MAAFRAAYVTIDENRDPAIDTPDMQPSDPSLRKISLFGGRQS